MEELTVNIDGKDFSVKIEEEGSNLKVHLGGKVYTVETSLKSKQEDYDILSDSKGDSKSGAIKASMPGVIFSVNVKEGDTVKKGDKLVVLIAMKLQNEIVSPAKGTVKSIMVKKDDKVNKGDTLLIVE